MKQKQTIFSGDWAPWLQAKLPKGGRNVLLLEEVQKVVGLGSKLEILRAFLELRSRRYLGRRV